MAGIYRYPKCPYCEQTMKSENSLDLANKQKRPAYWWKCQKCGKTTGPRETFNESLEAAIGWEHLNKQNQTDATT